MHSKTLFELLLNLPLFPSKFYHLILVFLLILKIFKYFLRYFDIVNKNQLRDHFKKF
jgi:hypothetical protein